MKELNYPELKNEYMLILKDELKIYELINNYIYMDIFLSEEHIKQDISILNRYKKINKLIENTRSRII